MKKLTIDDLQKIREEAHAEIALREGVFSESEMFRLHLLICGGTAYHSSGSIAVKEALHAELEHRGLLEKIKVVETGCNGFCAQGPLMVVYPEGVIYMRIKRKTFPSLLRNTWSRVGCFSACSTMSRSPDRSFPPPGKSPFSNSRNSAYSERGG